jgi:hypothetical protein
VSRAVFPGFVNILLECFINVLPAIKSGSLICDGLAVLGGVVWACEPLVRQANLCRNAGTWHFSDHSVVETLTKEV